MECPVCETEEWTDWDTDTQSGKCSNRHMIDTDPDGNLYCSAVAG